MNNASPAVSSAAPLSSQGLCLVFGASGYIGTHLVERLCADGRRVRACARSLEVLEARGWDKVELVRADALAPETLPAALAGVEVAYYLVHSMAAGRHFGELDVRAARHFAAAAAAAGVRRILYLGGLAPSDARSEHIVSRRRTGEVLREGPVPVTELRAGIIVGPGSAAFEVMRDLVFHLPLMITPRWVHSTSPPIALDNLLDYLARLPWIENSAGRCFDAAGPETLSYARMMRILAEVAGRRPPLIIPVPLLSPRLSAIWLHLVTAVPTPIARALVEGLRTDYSADDRELRALLAPPLLDFRAAVEAALRLERAPAATNRWRLGAFAMRAERPDVAYYAKRLDVALDSRASPAALWRLIAAIGGDTRYYYLNSLWTIREWLDRAIGGPGRGAGRRDPQALEVGDDLDHWRVLGVEPERRLTLRFDMRAPGVGIMEFELRPQPGGLTRLSITGYWHPCGIWGLLYWYALLPAHRLVFKGLAREISRRAEQDD